MDEMDLQEKVRMEDVHRDIDNIIDQISKLRVGMPLIWVWAWDVAKDLHKSIQEGREEEYCVTMDEDEMWQLFWTQADENGFTLEYGAEDLYEAIRGWMFDEGIIEDVLEEDEDDGE